MLLSGYFFIENNKKDNRVLITAALMPSERVVVKCGGTELLDTINRNNSYLYIDTGFTFHSKGENLRVYLHANSGVVEKNIDE